MSLADKKSYSSALIFFHLHRLHRPRRKDEHRVLFLCLILVKAHACNLLATSFINLIDPPHHHSNLKLFNRHNIPFNVKFSFSHQNNPHLRLFSTTTPRLRQSIRNQADQNPLQLLPLPPNRLNPQPPHFRLIPTPPLRTNGKSSWSHWSRFPRKHADCVTNNFPYIHVFSRDCKPRVNVDRFTGKTGKL
ncbi:hypothetical protein BC829DRAFT_392709 [Chytridium lagenaria]|nr:hypothetical protein BC829DRAFT_392709 [Chytridium lagenaria]